MPSNTYDGGRISATACIHAGKTVTALALPYADTDMMQLHLDEISPNVTDGAHAVLRLDRAGWHTTSKLDVPDNITPIFLPSRAPELNPVENVWQYLRQNWPSNTVFEDYDAIIDAACAAWRNLIAQPETITSIGMREWAHVGQPLEEVEADGGTSIWGRDNEMGRAYALKLTAVGAKAIGLDDGATPKNTHNETGALENHNQAAVSSEVKTGRMPQLRAPALAGPRAPRGGSKLAQVELLQRAHGTTIDELIAATGWLAHTTRAAMTGLRKRGYPVAIHRADDRGSFYRIKA
jgi:hypothetical protein